MGRALALDPDWGDGSIHEFYITYDGGRSPAMGGSVERARQHYERALQLTGGKKISPYVTWAEVVSVQAQDLKQFNALLDQALAFDVDEAPHFRLVNVIAQNRARWLKSRASDLFLEE
jgi:predicted anti-sigma-YlaC factor YlaD